MTETASHSTFNPEDDGSAHSSLIGGSSAARRLNCPRSYQLEMKLPQAALDTTSSYADEGSALHGAMQYILENNISDVDSVIGMEFGTPENPYVMTPEMVTNALVPALDYFDALADDLTEKDGDFFFIVEKRCAMPGIEGSFGTSDVIFRTPKRSGILDWKFGAGKAVYASYKDDEGNEHANEQGCYYGRSAAHTHPDMFERGNPQWPVEIHIVQPLLRTGPSYTSTTVTLAQLEDFRMRLLRVVPLMKADAPAPCKKGPWCDFAKCKVICEEWTGPKLDLARLTAGKTPKTIMTETVGNPAKAGELYGMLLDIGFANENIWREILKQAHTFMEAGHSVPGYKLVDKRPTEKYTDAEGAAKMAIRYGVPAAEVHTKPEIKSPAQLRAALADKMEGTTKKAREEAAKEKISAFTEKKSSGTTLAPETDERADVEVTAVKLQQLTQKLAQLTK